MPMPAKEKQENINLKDINSQRLNHNMSVRLAALKPSTFDVNQNSVKAIATTEKPVKVFDWESYDYVDEVLRMDGVILPESGKVPLLNSHNRYSVEDVLGSAFDFKTLDALESGCNYRAIDATVIYSHTKTAMDAAQKTKEGHLTDFSIGYNVLERTKVNEGETLRIGDDIYKGPVSVVTKWELKELSTTPIGADVYAKARSENIILDKKSDVKITNKIGEKKEMETEEKQDAVVEKSKKVENTADAQIDIEQMRQDAIRAERARVQEIQQRCSVAGLPDAAVKSFIDKGLSVEEASNEIFKRLESQSKAVGANRFEVVVDAQTKFRNAAIDGISFRAGIKNVEKPAEGYEDFRGRSLLRIAEECLNISGANTKGMRNIDIAGAALGFQTRGVAASTSDFPLILSAVANKKMLKAYTEASVTWDAFCNIVDAQDFKPMKGFDVSALPTLELINENGEYKNVGMSEIGESYSIKTYGNMFNLSRQMVINDDLRVFLKIPAMFGAASKRTINNHVYALLYSNPTLSDGSALFLEARGNLVTASGTKSTPNSASLAEGRRLMRNFKDIGANTALNLTPKYLVAGSKHEINIDIILASAALPTAEMSSGVVNPWQNRLIPVIDAVQDNYDADAWYLFPDKTAADTIEVAFLDGVEAPYLEDMVDFDTDGIKYKCRIDFGVGVMSPKIVKNPGK